MSSSGGLTSTPLRPNVLFNWVFLIELVVCGIVALFFLFYFNRVFAILVSYGIRAWTWHKYRVYVDIQSLQISLLAGRIFFRGVKYHGNNETILIHNGYITWVYWARNVREIDLAGSRRSRTKKLSTESTRNPEDETESHDAAVDEGEAGGNQRSKDLPCRLQVNVKGVEWFVYNRSVAYDAVLGGLLRKDFDVARKTSNPDLKLTGEMRKRGVPISHLESENAPNDSRPHSPWGDKSDNDTQAECDRRQKSSTASQVEVDENGTKDQPVSFILRFLPIQVHCTKAAVVMGNENTKSVLIVKMESASGEINASDSTELDPYRQLINFQFEHPVVQMKPNDDYKENQTAAASRVKTGEVENPKGATQHAHTHSFIQRQRRRIWHALQDVVPAFRSSVESFSSSLNGSDTRNTVNGSSWQGLSRYLDENEKDDRARWSSVEYATVTTIADCSTAIMSFYWDVAGTVPDRTRLNDRKDNEFNNINGDTPPEWGIKLSFKGSNINYGPWADRQRADLQRVFFPSLCKDVICSPSLMPGQYRVPIEFKLYIEFDDETTLRVPIREESKNWKWAKQADTIGIKTGGSKKNIKNGRKRKVDKGNPGPEVRPFGWIDIKIGSNATISYVMDMVAGPAGYSNKLELDLPSIEVTTSVNHGLLWKSVENRIVCDLSNPLKWNGHRTWKFDISSTGLQLFILREHIFLIIDLVDDWSTGPPPEYLTFCPFQYMINLHLVDFRIYLNVNDANIINNPSDFEDNTYIIVFGCVLDADICIPLNNYRPFRNEIPFKVTASNGGLNLHVPPWNTQATFLHKTEIATLQSLKIDGSYQYCATTSTSNTDTLLLNVHGGILSTQIYGFVIRYFLKIKDNYFGDDIRFKTLEEYQDTLRSRTDDDAEVSTQHPPYRKSNDLDVILTVTADESSILLPSNLYSCKKHIRIEIPTIAADLRFTNYYMDLDVVLSTLAFSYGSEEDGGISPISTTSGTQLFVDGITASGNRLFGLPPAEPTYICNWDFSVGAVSGECSMEFFARLGGGARAFAFSFDDDENALPMMAEIVLHDVTFLRASVESVRVWLHVDDAAFLFATTTISVTFNDWAGSHYSKKLKLQIPDLHLACVDAESASRHRSRSQHAVETHAFVQTSLSFTMIQRALDFSENRRLQQEHIKTHDQRTHRADFLLHPHLLDASVLVDVDPPAQSIPPLPLPVSSAILDLESIRSNGSSTDARNVSLRHKSSFLSISASSQSDASIVRPHSSLRARDTQRLNSRSRSLQTTAGPGRRTPLRDASASSGHQSSFYSAVGEHRSMPPSSVTFSSSYMSPYFPLEGVEPDPEDLPDITQTPPNFMKNINVGLQDVAQDRVAEGSTHISFMLESPSGVRGVFKPNAVRAVSDLLGAIQAVDPDDLLDVLQIDCMNDIFDLNRQKIPKGQVIDFCVRTSTINLRFVNSSVSSVSHNIRQDTHDQYDISVIGICVTLRSETALPNLKTEGVHESSAVHVSLVSATFSAKERYSDMNDTQAAINGVIGDIVFWVVSGDESSSNLAFKGLEIATASNKIEYLASLLHRTEVLGSDLAEMFSSQLRQQHNRSELFIFLVATAGQKVADPLFLTRPSYVLRSATDHLRTSDSWKIVTRLHHIFASLDPSTQRDITMRCLNNTETVPLDARQRVQASLSLWRSWDLSNINGCLVMKRVYGLASGSEPQLSTSSSRPVKMSFRTEDIRLVLDPGPKENEIAFSEVTAAIELRSSSNVKLDPQAVERLVQTTTVEMFCNDASITLNWELLELAEDIIQTYTQNDTTPAESISDNPVMKASKEPSFAQRQELHILVATNKASITLDSINIRSASMSKGLTASFVMINYGTQDSQNTTSLMLAAEAATSKAKTRSQELTFFQLRHPSLYTTYETRLVADSQTDTFKIAGNCRELSFLVEQDILALIEIFDVVVGDELAQLYRLKEALPMRQENHPESIPLHRLAKTTKLNVAMFLDQYQISMPLLQSLTYNVSGVVARASISAHLNHDLVFDFDIKEHSHDIQTVLSNTPKSISLLQMPPTNGRITSSMSAEENVLAVFASVEPIELDAAAVHSLLSALNRPEISTVVTDIQEDIKAVQSHLEEIFGTTESPRTLSRTKATPVIYEGHFTLAGFNVFANAQSGASDRKSARLDFNLGCVELLIANRPENPGPVFQFPQVRMRLRQVTFEISRWNENIMEPCGNLAFRALLTASSKLNDAGDEVKSFNLKSDGLEINLFADTASSVVDVIGHLQEKIKDIDLSREKQYLRKLRKTKPRISIIDEEGNYEESSSGSTIMFASTYSLEILNIRVSWLVGTYDNSHGLEREKENLVLSLKRLDLSTRKENSARLTLEDLLLQMASTSQNASQRSLNSALLPEVIFNVGYVSTSDARRLAFQAAGKSLDLRLTSQFMRGVSGLQKSINSAANKVRAATETWTTKTPSVPTESNRRKPFLGKKRMESLLVDADFAGAVVFFSGKQFAESNTGSASQNLRFPQAGKYGQFTNSDTNGHTALRAPGLAWKIEYTDNGLDDPSLNAEVKIDASSNILYPSVVPLIMEVSATLKDIVNDDDMVKVSSTKTSPQKFMSVDEDNLLTADPSAVLGRTRLNLGLRICQQEFTLSCQPIARVAATARFDDIYITINTVRSPEHGHFFAASATFSRLQASVQHVYSRESTGSFDVDSVFLSLMNSKHLSGTSGISAILKISPMKVLVNAKQLQDFLLFREIWVPIEIRQAPATPTPTPATSNIQAQTFLVQRYQQVAATGAFPWNATVSIAELDVRIDLGQAIGKSVFMISNFWISSKKNSDWEQNLCLGFDKVGVDSTGRMSGFVALQDFKMRTSIQWPAREMALNQTPLVQGSVSFSQFRVKAAFDYQAFLVADITSLRFLMYNVRNGVNAKADRLVAILDGEAVQVFCTTATASQALALYQAFQRLVQEKRNNYEASLIEIERFMKRKSIAHTNLPLPKRPSGSVADDKIAKSPISLHTDVIVTLKAVNMGAFPNTFSENQVFKLEALDAQARFAVTMDKGKIHSSLGLTLGQLRIGLAGVKKIEVPRSVGELSVEDVVSSATGSRGGTILKVPKVEATMQTWQVPNSNHIDYIFKSSFEGKVEVGWNYSRISYIRGMWASHSKALAQKLGKPLPPSAVKITGVPGESDADRKDGEQQKITAEVNMPQSKYNYTAIEPPIIETPQLRDMGEATPPLEWIGLHRDRLPNLTHQIVIVTLLELASEVEDAYAKILGSS